MNKLNEQYFKTRRNHERNYKNRKRLTWKRRILNVLVTWIFIYFFNMLHDYLNDKYEENKRKDMLQQQKMERKNKEKDTLKLNKATSPPKMHAFNFNKQADKNADTLALHCNVKIIQSIEKNMNNLHKNEIKLFLKTFHKECKNNAEYLEYSNEILFSVMNNHPKEVIEVMNENNDLDKEFIFDALSNPVNDKIDVKKLKTKLEALNDSLADKIIAILPEN